MNISGTLSSTKKSISGSLSETSGQLSGALAVTANHPNLTGRDEADQHPISAISNLEPELEWRPSAAMTNLDILAIIES